MGNGGQRNWTKDELREVAKWQKYIIWVILISLVEFFLPLASVPIALIQLYFIYKLATSIRSSIAWVYVVIAFFPVVSLIGLVVLNSFAIKILVNNRISVGFMGVKMTDFETGR